MARKGLSGLPIGPVLIFIVGIIVVLYILKNKNFLRFGSATAGAVTDPANPQLGETLPGPNIYTNLGDIPRSGAFGLSDANAGTSYRDNVSFPCDKCARETTWFVIPGTAGSGSSTGTDLTIKMGSHGEASDQTALIAFGAIPLGGSGGEWKSEGPHGTDAGVSGTAEGSVTLTTDTVMGIKGISWNKGVFLDQRNIAVTLKDSITERIMYVVL